MSAPVAFSFSPCVVAAIYSVGALHLQTPVDIVHDPEQLPTILLKAGTFRELVTSWYFVDKGHFVAFVTVPTGAIPAIHVLQGPPAFTLANEPALLPGVYEVRDRK